MNITTFKAFRSYNYRLYFAGQSVSLIGTWMQRTAVSWVIYTLTHSAFMLGVTAFATQFPSFLLSLFGGVVSDRYNRYKVMLTTQVASLIQATLLAVLVLSGHATAWQILSISIILGVINAFDVPARQSLVHEMIEDKSILHNAIALNSSMVNLASLLGPAMAGLVLQKLGAGFCFILNAASFVAVITSLLLMKLPKHIHVVHTKKIVHELREGFVYLQHTPAIAYVLMMIAFMSMFVLPYGTLLPIYAKVIFKGDASTFGYISSFIGLGAMGGTIFLASLKSGSNLKKILIVNTLIFGAALIAFSHITVFPIAMLFATISGFGMMSQTTVVNTIIQTNSSAAMRGRMVSYFAMSFFGMMPLGSLLIGYISQHIGVQNTILAQGIAAIIISLCFIPLLLKVTKKNTNEGTTEEIEEEDDEALKVL